MKKRIAALSMALVMGLGTVALAAGVEKTITVTPMGMTVNGQAVTPLKSDGTAAEVFAYDGATYVPLRYLSELLGIEVEWDPTAPNTAKLVSDKITVPAAPAGVSFKPGTYTGEATGFGGSVKVSVTFSANKIESITATGDKETAGLGSVAVEQLRGKIVDAQSTQIDGITGATFSSKAVIEAVNAAIIAAGADPAALVPGAANTGAKLTDTTVDAVVVGAGAAGLSAALRLKDLGQDNILVVEKMPYTGGASATCGGGFTAAESKYQTNYSVQKMVDTLLEKGHNVNDVELSRLHAENSGAAIDWIIDNVGAKFNPPADGAMDFVAVGGGAGFMKTMNEVATSRGIEIRLNTRATELVTANNVVTGVKVEDTDGNNYTISAKAVILATGGYGNNQELVKGANVGRVVYYGPASSDGDGLLMAQKLGAKVTNMQYLGVKPNGLEITPGVGKYTQPANNAMWKASAGILVNDKGQRLISETSGEYDLVQTYKGQNDWAMYTVMDQAAYDVFYKNAMDKHLLAAADIEKWFTEKGTGTTVFVKGDSIEDAARQAGVDGAELVKTIAAYNKGYAAGKDEFGRKLVAEFKTDGPVYIIKQNLRFATSLGGLDINTSCQVLLENDTPIEGLYAAGELVGNVQGDASTGYLSWAGTSGKLAAEQVAAKLGK